MNAALELDRHPCFNSDAKGRFGRVHLPVAPKCNIKCNYCNRKYDCVNESRPGVTSAVLSPAQALRYLTEVLDRYPAISVAGIAGPGDPMATPEQTLDTLRRVRERFPELLLCLATNGLGLLPHVEELAQIEVSHITVTVNAVDSSIASRIYSWARDGKVIYRGLAAAELLIERQLQAIGALKTAGITVKVNTIVIPGINDAHIPSIASKMASLGVDVLNCMPMYPNEDTPFADIPEPSAVQMAAIRREAEAYLPQMRHCTRCRADAVGLLDADRSGELQGCLDECARTPAFATNGRPYVAVASLEGMLVNQHLGEAMRFQIWGKSEGGGYRYIEDRLAPRPGGGDDRWLTLAHTLKDCRAVLVSGVGDRPQEVLTTCGVQPVIMSGFIEMALQAIFEGGDLSAFKTRRKGCGAGSACTGDGAGC